MGTTPSIHIVGAGLGGLTAAALLTEAGHPVVLHETRAQPGGNATTDTRDGFAWNRGPHALYRGGPATEVLASLGITPRGAVPPVKGMAVRDGTSFIAPGTPGTLVRTKLLGWRDKLELGRLLATIGRRDATALASVTVAEWVDDTASSPRVRELLHTLVRLGTYANLPETMSAEVALSQLQRSLDTGVLYLHGGWQQLVDALQARLTDNPLVTHADGVDELPDAAATIVAVGTPAAAGALVGTTFDVGPAAEVACLDLGIRGQPAHDVGLGVDVPLYLSRHSIAEGFAPPGHATVAVAEYLAPGTDPSKDRLADFAHTAGIDDDAVVAQRYLHRMTAVSAIPTATAGGIAGRPSVSVAARPGTFVVGDWVGPEGHLADAVFASARDAATAALACATSAPTVG